MSGGYGTGGSARVDVVDGPGRVRRPDAKWARLGSARVVEVPAVRCVDAP